MFIQLEKEKCYMTWTCILMTILKRHEKTCTAAIKNSWYTLLRLHDYLYKCFLFIIVEYILI